MRYFIRYYNDETFDCIFSEGDILKTDSFYKIIYSNGLHQEGVYIHPWELYTEVTKEVYLEHLAKIYLQNL